MTSTQEDLARIAFDNEMAEQAGLAERFEQERFEGWKRDLLEDGADESELTEENYADWLESMLTDD